MARRMIIGAWRGGAAGFAGCLLLAGILFSGCSRPQAISNGYCYLPGAQTRWASFENPGGLKGAGGAANRGAKGHPYEPLLAGESKTLLDVQGAGVITRIWMTLNDRTTETLRQIRLDMYWDGAPSPAVSVPLGDFFGAMLEKPTAFETALIGNPEGRSFNCWIPMPFRRGARVVLTNESSKSIGLLFYDIDYLMNIRHPREMMYFHAIWRREAPTALGRDFEILPRVEGRGRFLGAMIGVRSLPHNPGWWGEGEVKMFLDGDGALPTLVGTGTEDYIGTGWGQGVFKGRFQGCLVSDDRAGQYVFYRFHVPDPSISRATCA